MATKATAAWETGRPRPGQKKADAADKSMMQDGDK